MTFEELQQANKTINTTPIKGREYAEVNQRIKAFRMLFPMGTITTQMLSDDGAKCVFTARVADEEGHILGTGTAFEKADSSFINKTSYIENCETSAVGRALAMCGIGIDTSIASMEEVANAIENQNKTTQSATQVAEQKIKFLQYLNRHEYTKEQVEQICAHYKVKELQELTPENIADYIKALEKKGKKIDE